ncbi:MAG: SdrD B-like domain-containing protein, partial [Xenococcaceae cyanobacterium]
PDVEDILRSIKANNVTPYNLEVNGEKVPDASPGTNYEDALQSALKLLQSVDSEAGNANVIFISDGEPYPSPQEFSDEVAQLKALPAKLQAFGAGERAELPPLQILNPNAQIFTTTDDLLGVFSGLQPPSKVAAEPPLAGVTIYLDLNNNGQLDTDEPSQVTNSKGTFTFTDLVPGTYIVREVEPDGFTITAPEKGFATVTVEAGQGLTGVDFGNVESPATGSIAGLKWDDLNGNGGRDSQILKGFPPNAVFVVDLSGSTIINNFKGTPVGDVNNTGQANTVLDAELAGFTALNDQLINIGAGNESKVGIVVFAERGLQVDMDPATPGLQVYTTPLADNNRNGIPDVQEVLAQIQAFNPNYVYGQGTYQVKIGGQSMDIGAGTNFEPPLQLARSTAGAIGTEDINIIFLSDGNPGGGTQGTTYQYYQTNFLDEAQSIQASGFNVVAFGVGEGASLEALRKIDPEAQIFTTTDEIIDVFSGTGSGESGSISRGELEPVLPGVTVYVDLNNNGILDDGEPSQVTDDNGQYQFSDLKPGTYVVREIVPAGYRQTFPGDAHRVELGADQQVSGLNFGNVK